MRAFRLKALVCAVLTTGRSLPLLATVLLMPVAGVGANDPARVMVLLPVSAELPATVEILRALRQTIESGSERPVEIHVHAADFALFPSDRYQTVLADYLKDAYRSISKEEQPDVIVAVWSPAYRFFKTYRDTLFPDVPLIFVGMSRSEVDAIGTMPLSAGVITDFDVIGTLEAALTLRPSTQRVMVILGANPHERAALDIKEIEEHFAGRLEIVPLVGKSVPRLREILGELSSDTLVYYAHVFADDAGVTYVPADVLEAISPASAAPIFGAVETYVGRGIVGGHLYVPARAGQAAGELVLRVLRSESSDRIPVVDVQNLWAFDAREVARWGLNESDLPPDSEIRFRERTFWSEYLAYILGLLAFIILQALLIGFLLRERRVRLRAESRALSLGHRLATAHEEERMELARDLHDNLQQQLGYLAITAGSLQEELASVGVQSPVPGILRDRLVGVSGEVRALAHRLHPPELEELGLTDALRVECARFSQVIGIPVRLVAEPALPEPSRTVGLALYRVVQEALQNVAKHARARGVVVSLEVHDGRLLLGVRDDGEGFRPGPKIRLPSLGLYSMRERVRAIGGSLEIDSAQGDGTAVLVSVPLSEGATS